MPINCCPFNQLPAPAREDLERRMTDFYENPPPSYYVLADQSASQYHSEHLPFHCDLVAQVERGMHIGEFGCGTAHLCPEVEARGGHYTGFDWSTELLAKNRVRFPNATFRSASDPGTETFDLVASLYTIEHVVDPVGYLEQLWSRCRPGGLIAIICPEFIDCPALAPSVFFGRTPRRLREKVQVGHLLDALEHVMDWKLRGPKWKKRAVSKAPGAFWINEVPKALFSQDFTIDADAVHLVRLADLVWWFERAGAQIVRTSREMANVAPEILLYNAYVLARKPGHSEPSTDKDSDSGAAPPVSGS